jgi:hypothetical protein
MIGDARPWTPELRAEQEALSLVRFCSNPPISKDELIARISRDETIAEPIRARALVLASEY